MVHEHGEIGNEHMIHEHGEKDDELMVSWTLWKR